MYSTNVCLGECWEGSHMIGKTLRIEKSAGHHEWGAKTADAMGVQYAWVKLGLAEFEDIVRQFNAASEAGAPWPKLEIIKRR